MTVAGWMTMAAVLAGGGPCGGPCPVAVGPGGGAPESPVPHVRVQAQAPDEALGARPDTLSSVEEILEGALEEVAAAFAWAWSEGDVERIEAHLAPAPQRIRLQLGPSTHAGLTRRQATAALGDVLATRRANRSQLEQVTEAGGNPERGFAEVLWSSVPDGTNQRVTYTVYVGFLRLEEEWRVLEIRVLR